ncbi:MAG TPA: PaaI family thioesterase [Planctomycetota bacterium]|nr:PaaI family thioesterase [Planctomycetota bacterium]
MNPLELPGLERVQRMIDGRLPPAPITDALPMRVLAAERGRVTFTARADARHLNPMGGVHGGFMAAVLDSATGTAVQTTLEPGASYSTVDLHVQMLKPVPTDRDLSAEGRVLHSSRNVAAAEADLRDADGALLARATATCVIHRPRPAG